MLMPRQKRETSQLEWVHKLAQADMSRPNQAEGRRVQEAASICLPLMEARIAEEESTSTLLRASEPLREKSSDLLRPLEEKVPASPQEQLLRATVSEDLSSAS
jgi:hypothetical protein